MKIENNDIKKLRELEESLWIAKTRFDQEYMNKILSPDFFEFYHLGTKNIKSLKEV